MRTAPPTPYTANTMDDHSLTLIQISAQQLLALKAPAPDRHCIQFLGSCEEPQASSGYVHTAACGYHILMEERDANNASHTLGTSDHESAGSYHPEGICQQLQTRRLGSHWGRWTLAFQSLQHPFHDLLPEIGDPD